jgi:acetate kinase
MNVLVLNCGSSSVKFQLFETSDDRVRLKGLVEKIGSSRAMLTFSGERTKQPIRDVLEVPDHERAVRLIMEILCSADHGVISDVGEIHAVGHRTVHGGEEFSGSALITPEVIAAMERCVPFAPLHNPANIVGIRIARRLMPETPQVAVFDTAFHSRMPRRSFLYGLPYEMYEKHGIRRYGFHGTSHRFVAERAAAELGRPLEKLKLITCHLGNGSSIAAIDGGVSIDTSMGFTPLEGLVMGTRCGDLDPAVVAFIQGREGLSAEAVDGLMNKRSGLLGLSGVSNDMRELEDEAGRGNERAQLALEIFCLRVTKYIGAYAAELGGVDGIVFTGGIGENAVEVRRRVLGGLAFMGIKLDAEANRRSETCITNGRVKVLVIRTNEELAIVRETVQVLADLDGADGSVPEAEGLGNLAAADRREFVRLWADSTEGDLATLAARFGHRLHRPVSVRAVEDLLASMGLLEKEGSDR